MQAIHNHKHTYNYPWLGCFKEQRYKINASNSQLVAGVTGTAGGLFQRAKIQDKCKQFTTLLTLLRVVFSVVSKSKDTR